MVGAPDRDRDEQGRLDPYLPRAVLRHLVGGPPDGPATHAVEGTVVFTDISGFTKLSERLARRGREGAEELVGTIETSFSALLAIAEGNGGHLLKFGGDALLLLFEGEGHLPRACRAAVGMRRALRDLGDLRTSAGRVRLRMSQGVHSGVFHLFLVGESHRELLIAGSAATVVTRMEKAAEAGEIIVSDETAALLAPSATRPGRGGGRLLAAAPRGDLGELPHYEDLPSFEELTRCLSTEVRAHVLSGHGQPEHRHVTTAFVKWDGTDALVRDEGPEATAAALHELVRDVQVAVDQHEVCFLESDVDADGGKLMLTAGAPRMAGDDEERMLLALRRVVDGERRLPVRIGVNRGGAFTGDVGPWFRRSYSVMGDSVNLAARVMAKAPPGAILSTSGALERSATRFATTKLEPFAAKGKKELVQAWAVGYAIGSRSREGVAVRFPFVGRRRELRVLDAALRSARDGSGRLVEISGEPGIGKTRLVEELREQASAMTSLQVTCEAYTASTPYATWRALLRPLIGARADDPDENVLELLSAEVSERWPELETWLALLAVPFGTEAPPSREVRELAPEFRRTRLHEVVFAFLERQLEDPALVAIEDAHLMDAASADLLRAIAARLEDVPWLVVVTRRDTGAGFTADAGGDVVSIEPRPLSDAEALSLAEAATDAAPLPPHVVRLAAERSGGSPQFLRDLLRAAAADGGAALPDSIETAAMARIDRLDPAERALVRRAAVLGLRFHPRHLPDVLLDEVPEPDADTWDRLSAFFVEEPDGQVRFRRAVMRDAAYAGLPFRVRRRLHAGVAARLEREAGGAPESADILSLHFALAGDHGPAWRHARVAGDRARERLAHADAAKLYQRAIEAGRAIGTEGAALADIYEALGEAHAHTGELADAHAALTNARRLTGDDPVGQARLLLSHAKVAERAGRVLPAVRWAQRGLRAVEGDRSAEAARARARTISLLATVRQREGRCDDAIALCERAIDEAEACGEDAALAHACFILDWALFDAGRPDEARYSPRALEIYEQLGELDREAAVLNNMGGFAYHEGRWDDAVDLYRRSARASERAGDVANAAFGDCNVGEVLADQGELEEAEAHLRRALRIWRGSGYDWGTAFATALLGRTVVRGGRAGEGAELLDAALHDLKELRAMADLALVQAYRAEAHAFAGEPDAALREADALLPAASRTTPLLHRVRGFALSQLDDAPAAERALEAAIVEARARGIDYELAVSLHALQALHDLMPDRRAGRRLLLDVLLRRLHVVALPAPPLVRGATALSGASTT